MEFGAIPANQKLQRLSWRWSMAWPKMRRFPQTGADVDTLTPGGLFVSRVVKSPMRLFLFGLADPAFHGFWRVAEVMISAPHTVVISGPPGT